MQVHYHNRRQVSPEDEFGATYHASLEDMLRVSDFLSINAPMTPQTQGFLNEERIALLPDGAVVVNTARGGLAPFL